MPSIPPTEDGEVCFSEREEVFVNTRAQKIVRLKNKQYRDAFVASQISIGLPFQIRALRESPSRNWKQSELADRAGMLQPRISAMESPGGAKFSLETLRRLASAFDVGLIVKFAPFSELVEWSERFDPDAFNADSFEEDIGLKNPKADESRNASGLLARDQTPERPQAVNRVRGSGSDSPALEGGPRRVVSIMTRLVA
jgi:transcriptional regulator with XRE-family HTH domain